MKQSLLTTTASHFLYLALMLSFFVSPASSAERAYLDISASGSRKINIAVPPLMNAGMTGQQQRLGREMANTLAEALQFHGIISIVPADQYGDSQSVDWKSLGCDYTVLGQYSASATSLDLELRLFDVAGNEVIMGKTYSGTPDQKLTMLFRFCDSVLETLTGKPGIASSKIAFVNRENNVKEVYLTDILGKNFRQITRHQHLTVSPRFVPGGNFLTYSSYHSGNQNLYITDLRQNKTTRALSRRKGLNLAPAWSPDGKYMILTLSESGNPDLYLLDSKGEIIEQLTRRTGINVSPSWSPDGKNVVFVSDRSGKPQLFLMDMTTRKVKRLTFDGSENAEPSWSPTENLIVYSSLRDGVYQLYTLNPFNSTAPQQITSDLSHHESPSWSPDGNQIIFAKRDGKSTQIYGIMKDGSFQRRLFAFPGSQSYPQWSR